MAKEKHYVFSARTTEEGLRALNRIKVERGIGWDELVINAVCAHYGLDMGVMALPKAERPPESAEEPKLKKPRSKGKDRADKSTRAGKVEAETGDMAPRVGLEPTA